MVRPIPKYACGASRVGVAAFCLLLAPATAYGRDDEPLPPNRDEFIPVPDVGGNSDIGVEFGAAGSYVRFHEGYYPYVFRIDAVASMSVKDDLRGFRPVQQYHTIRVDAPQFLSPRLRLDARVDFLRAVDATWFGVGNASVIVPRPVPVDAASGYEVISEHVRFSALARIKTNTPFELALFTHTRYEFPSAFPGSKLSDDFASGAVVGGKPAFLETVAAGFMVDTRNNEILPRRGIFYQVGLGGTLGSAEKVRFGEASATALHFASLARWLIFANRFIASFKFGTVPFYELQQGDVFNPQYLVGGDGGVRGVRLGRYAGQVKAISNTELRFVPIPRFHVFHWSVLPGSIVFFDAGRVWSDYAYHPDVDGRRLGLKWGLGSGLFFQWDEANLFLIEGAYSTDETGRDLPLSFYFESLLHF
jgi:hypothetical protein